MSGYVVPGLRASATGSICVSGKCEQYENAQSYHDHNWGVWRGVTWEWGASRAGQYTLLYGRVQPADSVMATQPLFVFVTDSLGFLGLFRPRDITYEDGKVIRVPRRDAQRAVARGRWSTCAATTRCACELTIEDATATDTRTSVERGDALAARRLAKPYFVQMKGLMRISGRVGGRPLSGEGAGFFETYR